MNIIQQENENAKAIRLNALKTYKTELRRDVIARRRERTRIHLLNREKTRVKRISKVIPSNVVTIDTNKARSNTDVLRLAIRDLGWREFPFQRRDHNCDITWHAISFHDQSEIYSGQVNKFPGSVEVFRKVNTFRWLEFMKALFPSEYDFFPRTWLLPYHYNEFAFAVRSASEKKNRHKPMYIVKPSEGSQGQGIYLLEDPLSYSNYSNRSHVVQEYLSNVFLIDKYKFDLRIYVVVKSLDPLELHICREGLARFSTVPYEKPSYKNMHETFMHLTNYSLNKKSSDFKISEKDDEGSKRKMSAVFKKIGKLGHDVEVLWKRIEHLVTKTLIAVAGELKVEYQAAIPTGKPGPTCFQVLGFDIILLKNLQPMLLEVNSNPSLSITEEQEATDGGVEYMVSAKDEEVKRTLIRDTLMMVAPKNKFTRKRRKRHLERNQIDNAEEDMDIDTADISKKNSRRILQRERGVSITYNEGETVSKDKSMFQTSEDYTGRRSVRKETCRVFIEGEEETVLADDESQISKYSSESSVHQQSTGTINSLRRWFSRKIGISKNSADIIEMNDHFPDVFSKNENKSEDAEDDIDSKRKESQSSTSESTSTESSDTDTADVVEDDEEEEQSCLTEIFPALYGESFKGVRIVERLADIFILCLGVKGCLRLSPSMFRLFARKCHLNRKGITSADIDILYIDMQRKWEYMNPDRTSGFRAACIGAVIKRWATYINVDENFVENNAQRLNFFAFVSGCCKIATDAFSGATSKTQINGFIEHCHSFLKIPTDLDLEAAKRASRYGSKLSRRNEKDSLKLPSAEVKQRTRSNEVRPILKDESYSGASFPVLNHRHRNIFHVLQSIKK